MLLELYPTLFLIFIISIFVVIGIIAFKFLGNVLSKSLNNKELVLRVSKLEEEVEKLKKNNK